MTIIMVEKQKMRLPLPGLRGTARRELGFNKMLDRAAPRSNIDSQLVRP
jgi:hypothetical protein